MNERSSNVVLHADWRHLVMANYAVDAEVLEPLVPAGTELDEWNGTVYASLVAFNFLNTRIKGIQIPFHTNFEEINLRFYVRHRGPDEWRRGVVFVKEIVPRTAIARMARLLYNENYVALPTRHHIMKGDPLQVGYEWRWRGHWNRLEAHAKGKARPLKEGSEAQFISEHYWGYTAQRNGGTKEYRVEHPAWRTWTATDFTIDVDVATLYGSAFTAALTDEPTSVFIAEGSAITVSSGTVLA